ncbi:MAG: aminotransferase class III-fold pyridoxal phosphate-dependent enzyme [Candidatus Kapabacteria bacterium]|nr:aminotransferase class III-fold pyridoxal phosphate-dependent enzyme [Candidatus Kapabacteria bacterium]
MPDLPSGLTGKVMNSVCFNDNYPVIERSLEMHAKAKKLIPGATQTLAKGTTQHSFGVSPVFLDRGKGAIVWDIDGNEYLDYTMGVGPVVLGYCYEPVDYAISQQLTRGISFSLTHPLEVQVASLLHDIIPNAEMVRFSKTGADVTSAAVRLARAYTGRNVILCCGYHGWHDWYIATTDRTLGVPDFNKELTYTFAYNDTESLLSAIDGSVAAVIMEPATFSAPRDNFLHKVREICHQNGSLLIFDEMWTGFRLALGGAQEYFGVKADLACFSKAIANGMPLSALTGCADVMKLLEQDVFFYTTFGGETLSLAAAVATIEELRDNNIPSVLDTLGRKLKTGINKLIADIGLPYILCSGFPCRTMLNIDSNIADANILKTYIQQELIKRGILWNGFHTLSASHTQEDIQYTLEAYDDIFTQLHALVKRNELHELLRGEVIQPAFRKTTHFNSKPRR